MKSSFKCRKFFDMHVHLRQGELLERVVEPTVRYCDRAMLMPNLAEPLTTPEKVIQYQQEVGRALRISVRSDAKDNFSYTFALSQNTNPDHLPELLKLGVVAGKLYPQGVTTNSQHGLPESKFFNCNLQSVFDQMQRLGIVLSVHAELPKPFVLDREAAFLEYIDAWSNVWPRLRIVIEHCSTKAAVDCVKSLRAKGRPVFGSITPQHLYYTLDDLLGGLLRPHLYCKPVFKRPDDRQALREVALAGNSGFFLGSDSAPHHKDRKEASECCAGFYAAPHLGESLVELFAKNNVLENFENFTWKNASEIYRLEHSGNELEFERVDPYLVETPDNPVDSWLGENFSWRLK